MDAKVMGGKYKRVDIIVGAVCTDHVNLRFGTTGNADGIIEHSGSFCCICSGTKRDRLWHVPKENLACSLAS